MSPLFEILPFDQYWITRPVSRPRTWDVVDPQVNKFVFVDIKSKGRVCRGKFFIRDLVYNNGQPS